MFSLNKRRYIKIGAAAAGAIFLFLTDRILKFWALNFFYNQEIDIINGWLKLDLFKNENIAFSLPLPQSVSVFAAIAIICLLAYYFAGLLKKDGFNINAGAILFIILGAFSNIYDRIYYGYVIDYINFNFWPVFNLADAMISGGVAVTIFFLLKTKK